MMEAVPGRLLLAFALLWAPSARAAPGGITVDVSDRCPGREQIIQALEARMPGLTGPDASRRLELARAGEGLTLRLREGGAVALERRLTVDERAPANEGCAALAEAAAQVVVRYLREIGYRQPIAEVVPVMPSPRDSPGYPLSGLRQPRFRSAGYLGASAGLRAAGSSRAEAAVAFLLHRGRLAGELSAGATTETTAAVEGTADAALRLRSFPLRLLVGVRLPVGSGTLVPAVGAALDLLSFRAAGLDDARSGLRVEPAVEGGLSYLWSGSTLFARAGLFGGRTVAAHDFDAGLTQPVFRTPGAYLRAQVELGFVLWKNSTQLGL
jgi:hypothetical protein